MIIKTEQDVTAAVLAEISRADDPRVVEILSALVRHLHDFAREVRLTEAEFQAAIGYVVALGQRTTESHNEAVLTAGSLGLSTLICLLNNGRSGQEETTANLLGPFWRAGAPFMESGASIIRSPTPGQALFATIRVEDTNGLPVADADVDIWQASPEGYYENQDPDQADMNLRGCFKTNAGGEFKFRSVLPTGYPIPVDGPAGELARTLKRHNMRPAHIHFLIAKEGFKTQTSQVYLRQDPNLETDVQFGVTERLIGNFTRHDDGTPAGFDTDGLEGAWYELHFTFTLEPGASRLPKPPIAGKATGERPRLQRLVRE
ncbi:MAG: Hydroxyquinol 1,2-dioxygenase [Pseudomonadota bacterium]|jgi:catechol 1,2-dioxygenase